MSVEDQLSKTLAIIHSVQDSTIGHHRQRSKLRIITEVAHDDTPERSKMLNYKNDEDYNLQNEQSPRKIKIRPNPAPEQFKRQHLFVEEAGEILEDSYEEDIPYP